MTTVSTSRRLLILSCSMTKRAGPKWMPARDRYDGPLWRTLRHVDPGEQKARVAILSAHHGLRDANMDIEQYEARMTPEIAAAMKMGGLGKRWPRPKTERRVMPSGEHAGEHIASMTRYGGSRSSMSASSAEPSISTSCSILWSCSVRTAL